MLDRSRPGPPDGAEAAAPLRDLESRMRDAPILLVDDEPLNLTMVERILRRSGFVNLTSTSEPGRALALFREVEPDLVLLDLQMPQMSGYEVMEQLRPLVPAGGYLPVLVVTGDSSVQARQRALASGARDYVCKPFDPLELVLRVRNHLQTRLLHDALQDQNAELERRVRERTAELDAARQRAEEASLAKSNFLAVMSHELRTPLTGIISHAELLTAEVAGELSNLQQEMVARISSAGWHLSQLIQDILEFANGQISLRDLRSERLDLRELARETVDLLAPAARAQGLEIRLRAPGHPVTLTTDPTCARRILLNLASNAVKFSLAGEIMVELRDGGDEVLLLVHDQGIGIAPEHLDRIWEPFWQVEDPLTRRAGGTGLGLGIVRAQTELLGGTVGVASEPGRGSTFTVRLPRHG